MTVQGRGYICPCPQGSIMKNFHSTILVVEDDANDQEMIKVAFRGHRSDWRNSCCQRWPRSHRLHDGRGQILRPHPISLPHLHHDRPENAPTSAALTSSHTSKPTPPLPSSRPSSSPPPATPTTSRPSYLLGASSYHVKPHNFPELRSQLKVLHDYWMTCQVPEVDASGKQLPTDSKGKLGEKFPQPSQVEQVKVNS